MPIPFNIQSARDTLDKARREYEVLRTSIDSQDKQAIGDALYNFSVTIHSVKDWLINQKGSTYSKKDVEGYVSNNQPLAICRDLSNANKHMQITKYIPETQETTASATVAKIPLRRIRELIFQTKLDPVFRMKVVTKSGKRIEVIQLADDAIKAWEAFFNKYRL